MNSGSLPRSSPFPSEKPHHLHPCSMRTFHMLLNREKAGNRIPSETINQQRGPGWSYFSSQKISHNSAQSFYGVTPPMVHFPQDVPAWFTWDYYWPGSKGATLSWPSMSLWANLYRTQSKKQEPRTKTESQVYRRP